MESYLLQIIVSLKAALIFWLVFSFFPKKIRRDKIRPKLLLDKLEIYRLLSSSLFLIFKTGNKNSTLNFIIERFISNNLSEKDFELALMNKCLNETYLYDPIINKKLIVIGPTLFNNFLEINELVEEVFTFNEYLSSKEIIVLEKIRKFRTSYYIKFHDKNGIIKIGNQEIRVANPSLSQGYFEFFNLYKTFINFQEIFLKNDLKYESFILSKVQYFFAKGYFKKCKRFSKRALSKHPMLNHILPWYLFKCEYSIGNKKKAIKILEKILKEKKEIFPYRGFVLDYMGDKNILAILKNKFTENEISKVLIEKEERDKEENDFFNQAIQLKKYYEEKQKRK